MMDATQRGNYESGSDYVLEYGELRFTFNERDFTERVEQAAIKLGFVPGPLERAEREDLVNLTVNGEATEPASALGEHINACWPELNETADRSLVHWLRRPLPPVTSSGRTPASPTVSSSSGCERTSVSAIRRRRVVVPEPGGPPTA